MSWPTYAIRKIRQGPWENCVEGGGRIRQLYYTLPDGKEVTFKDLKPGAMWHSSQQPNYQGNPGPCVLLPGRVIWRMAEAGTNGHMWKWTGEVPNVAAVPSINYVGIYHGWVQAGVVTDDCEGRKFTEMGERIK